MGCSGPGFASHAWQASAEPARRDGTGHGKGGWGKIINQFPSVNLYLH